MDFSRSQRIAIILILANVALGRVLVDVSDDILDLGSFLQYKGVNFSLNGKVDVDEKPSQYCGEGRICSSDVLLPQEVENRIYDVIHNATLLNEEAPWIDHLPKAITTPLEPNSEVAKPRKKRFLIGLAVGLIGCMIFCKGGSSGPVVDPYAEDRFLLEQERSKMETIQFCYNTCAKEWSQWTSCDKQCGSGSQTRERVLTEPASCIQKWQDYEFGDFVCPYTDVEERSCNEGCPNGGEPNSVGCTCFDGWGGTCCERKLYCDYPGQPANGKTTITTSPSPVGSIVMFSCDPGYMIDSNGASYSLCQQNQQWTTTVPSCNRITCTTPSLTQHVEVLNSKPTYNFGETIHFKCAQGFFLQGPESRMCQDSSDGSGRWSLYTPYCAAVECPVLTQADIANGFVHGADYSYQATITFECHDGYELIGLSTLTCTKHGRWSGFYPTCNEITCSPPYPPVNGDMQIFGSNTVVFSCQEGYRLTDDTLRVAVCDDNGQWDKPTPTCQAIECDGTEINNVENGYVNGGVYRFPFSVNFGCYPGYVLQGLDEITCQETGVWSGDAPTCSPCPMNTYMEEWSTGGVCTECPANTHTATEGSTNRQQCICDMGFNGPNGGPCQEVRCTLPNVPIHGSRGICEVEVGLTCSFTCDSGYVRSAGASEIECLPNGEWGNDPPSCSACPADTYNPADEPNICLPCPEHMWTEGRTGQTLEGCVCTVGWEDPSQPGEVCEDINECELLTGGLACEDTCVNTPGSFRCECNRPGTVLNADGQSCDVVDSCRELTGVDAPSNGALVCTHNIEESSRFCAARCNPGFEFAGDTPNSYDTCDSSTLFNWPFESFLVGSGMNPTDARLADCIPEFFPGFQLNAEIFYLSAVCRDLTPEQQASVINAFVGVLENGNVCSRSPLSCAIENVQIICGSRKKRDINGNLLESVDFNFNVTFGSMRDKLKTADCDSYVCPLFKILPHRCEQWCRPTIKNYAKALARYAKMQLQKLSADKDRVRFTILNEKFVPEEVRVNDDNEACARSGQQYIPENGTKEAYCVPCRSGQYLDDSGVCEACPAGTHQLLPEQMSCPPCPVGSYSEVGWSYCLTCEAGFYGENCGHQCTCVHGKCDTQTGDCSCDPGWEGPNCSVDIDRCQAVVCQPGTTCQDRHPPQDGFDCV